jgi:hypothetical protein
MSARTGFSEQKIHCSHQGSNAGPSSPNKIFRARHWDLRRDWRRLHNEELRELYSSSRYYLGAQIKDDKMGGARGTCRGEERGGQDFAGKTSLKDATVAGPFNVERLNRSTLRKFQQY